MPSFVCTHRFSEDFEFNIHFQDEKEVDAEKEEDEYLKADETYKNFFEAVRPPFIIPF